jgi:collagenase-like PrtC family protease
MNFTIPSDYNKNTINELTNILIKYPIHQIVEVYGNLSNYIIIGSGRGYLETTEMCATLDSFEEYVRFINTHNIKFNYTINAACTENVELKRDNQRDIIRKIDRLIDIGVTKFTVASLPLLNFLHVAYRDKIQLTLSTIANINSVARAKQAERMGANTIVLAEDLTRDIECIRQICYNTSSDIEIIINSMCNFNCIFRNSHYNALAHYKKGDNNTMIHYFPAQCSKFNNEEPVELLKSPWIRPEDLSKYKDLGISLFKIIGREIVTQMQISKMLEYYFKGEFDGNLLELNNGFSLKTKRQISNKQLEGFVDYFFEHPFRCLDICGTNQCDYCFKYLERALIC